MEISKLNLATVTKGSVQWPFFLLHAASIFINGFLAAYPAMQGFKKHTWVVTVPLLLLSLLALGFQLWFASTKCAVLDSSVMRDLLKNAVKDEGEKTRVLAEYVRVVAHMLDDAQAREQFDAKWPSFLAEMVYLMATIAMALVPMWLNRGSQKNNTYFWVILGLLLLSVAIAATVLFMTFRYCFGVLAPKELNVSNDTLAQSLLADETA